LASDEKRTTNDERRIKILEYIMKRQHANKKTTKSSVIEYMKENKLSSRETSHKLIKALIDAGILNKEELNSQMHFLTINKKWDIHKVEIESLMSQIKKTVKPMEHLFTGDKVHMEMGEIITPKGVYSASVSFKKKKKESKPN
jgi:hypothetical protein